MTNKEPKKRILNTRRGELTDDNGRNLHLCMKCEAHPDVDKLGSIQAIGVLNGLSVCRTHMEEFLKNQPLYFNRPEGL